jgi:hypothetical protein
MLSPEKALKAVNDFKNTRLMFEPEWYRAYEAYENNVFVNWDRYQQTLVRTPYRKKYFTLLPEIKLQADGLENQLLKSLPIFVIYPDDISQPGQIQAAADNSKILRKYYNDWVSTNIIHQYIHLAIKYPMSFFEIHVEFRLDPATGLRKREIVPEVTDVFDWLFDPRVPFQENAVVIKKIRKTAGQLDTYQNLKVNTSSTLSVAEDLKEMLFNNKYGPRYGDGDLQPVLLYQVMEKTKYGMETQIIDTVGKRYWEKTYKRADRYPVVPLQLSSGDSYAPSFVNNLIPISRSIDLVHNRIEDFILKFAKGQYLLPEGSDVTFSDEGNVIVRYSGQPPTVLDIPQLPPALMQWYNQLFSISERYGINNQALGGTPRGSQMRSAKMMQQTAAGTQGQQKTPLDNVMWSFKQIAMITLAYLAEYTDTATPMTFRDPSGQTMEQKTFIGEKYKTKAPNATIIPTSINGLDVDIEDASSESIAAKKEAVIELAELFPKINPAFQKVLLDLYKIGSTKDLIDDYNKGLTMQDNPEFQALIAQAKAGNLDPQTKQALSIVLGWLAKNAPTPHPDNAPIKSKPPTPAAPPQNASPAQPAKNPAVAGATPKGGDDNADQ